MRHALPLALLALALASPALAEPVLHCDSDGCAWVEETDPVPGVSLYREQRSTRSIPAELWMPTPRVQAAPTVVQPPTTVPKVHPRDHRRGDPVWKQACRAHGVYPRACLPSIYGRHDHRRSHAQPVRLPAQPAWPRGVPSGSSERRVP